MVSKPHKSAERKKSAPTGRVLTDAELVDRLTKAEAISGNVVAPAKAFEKPSLGLSLGLTLADRLAGIAIEAVLPDGSASTVLAFSTALGLGARLLTECGDAKRVLVVTDVVDGKASLMESLGRVPADALAGVGCLVELAGAGQVAEGLGVPFVSLVRAD
ncbi:MAG: hypothetical protein ACRDJU_10055 [Actinomycetota bacterium]